MLPVALIETSPDVDPVAATTCPSVTLPGLVTNTPAELAVALNEAPATSERLSGTPTVPIVEPGAWIDTAPLSSDVDDVVRSEPPARIVVVPCGLTIFPWIVSGPVDDTSTTPGKTLKETLKGLSALTDIRIVSRPEVT